MSAQRFRKKPVEIEAWQLDVMSGSARELANWCGGRVVPSGIEIDTLEGTHLARDGDWVIRGVAGEFYPCKEPIFLATYEPVTPAWVEQNHPAELHDEPRGRP